MREIMFRGKAANRDPKRSYRTKYRNGDWVFGLLTDPMNYAGFAEMVNTSGVTGIEVDRSTVGQYTGMTDKADAPIYEDDIVRYGDPQDGTTTTFTVVWGANAGAWMLRNKDGYEILAVAGFRLMLEVIGNRFDGIPGQAT